MLSFDSLDMVAEASIGLKKVTVYRNKEGRYFIYKNYSAVENECREIHPAEAVAWYNKVNMALDWAIKIPTKEDAK